MTNERTTTGRRGSRAGETRAHILELLREHPAGVGVQELGSRLELHANTVRFHLDRLVADGEVERGAQERTEPGRPRLLYVATASSTEPERDYQLLAEILAGFVATVVDDPAEAATEAGRSWGHYLADRPPPFRRTGEGEATDELMRILDEIGFRPELLPDADEADDSREVHLHHCPFLEVATEHQTVVCSIHLGLMQGALAEMRAPVDTDLLEPFVEPSLCVARLAPRAGVGG